MNETIENYADQARDLFYGTMFDYIESVNEELVQIVKSGLVPGRKINVFPKNAENKPFQAEVTGYQLKEFGVEIIFRRYDSDTTLYQSWEAMRDNEGGRWIFAKED